MNTKNKVFTAAGIILGIGLISVAPKIAWTSSRPAARVNASQEEIMSYMANELCDELKQGTELRRASVRAGTAARKEFNATKQILEMAKEESFNEDLFVAVSDICQGDLDAAMIRNMESK